MAIINQSNILNLQPGIAAPVVVHMSEGDVGTKLSFKLIDGARAWTDPGNVVAAVHGRHTVRALCLHHLRRRGQLRDGCGHGGRSWFRHR